MRGVVEVVPASREQERVLANLLELYSYDFSAFADLQIQSDGRFGYPRLSLYWQEEGRQPFLIYANARLAGFALISRGSQVNTDPEIWDMTEFFILRGLRNQGFGTDAVHQIWRRIAGRWEVRVLQGNEGARTFWAAAICRFTGSPEEVRTIDVAGKLWHVFSFTSGGSGA